MDDIASYRDRHHQAYLARRNMANAAASNNQVAGCQNVTDTTMSSSETCATTGSGDVVNIGRDSFAENSASFESIEALGDPLYESSVALARRLQQEMNSMPEHEHDVRRPDDTYQDQILGSESDDAELQAVIAKSLIEM